MKTSTISRQASDDVKHWVDVFVRVTEERPSSVYATSEDGQLTYGELRESVDRLASGLLERGVRPGQVLAIWMTNGIDLLVAQWATYRLGCSLLPLYSYYRKSELEYALAESRATVLFTARNFDGKTDPVATLLQVLPELRNEHPSFVSFPNLRLVAGADDLGLAGVVPMAKIGDVESIETEGLDRIHSRISPFDIMNVMYTSGTTGVPKAGLSLHSNNLSSIREWSALARLDENDVILAHVPMFTNFGGLYANGLALYNGCRMEVTRTFDAAESLRRIDCCGVTYVPGSPEIFRMLLDHPDFSKIDVSRIQSAHVAGSSIEPELMRRIVDELAPNAMQAYGMSECGGIATVSSDRDPIERRLDSVGKPIDSVAVQIHDPIAGKELPVGEIGEIWFGDVYPGSCVGKGYLAAPRATAAAVTSSGWFRSGDLGKFDIDGYLHFTGRLKNMITVGGFNVYPTEVERHLAAHPSVVIAHVVGVPDERLGTVPVAFVVVDQPLAAATLMAFMAERVSSQKRPRAIWIVKASELPMTPSGKVRTGELAERAVKLLAR